MSTKISEMEFFHKTNHASVEYLVKLSKVMEEMCFIAINPNQDRLELIDTLFSVYFKNKARVHEHSFLPSNHRTRFDFNVHISCPFSEQSMFRFPYCLLADHFGFNTPFLREEAIKWIDFAFKDIGTPLQEKTGARLYVYRIFQQLAGRLKKFGTFGTSSNFGKNLIIYEVDNWENGYPIFKEVMHDSDVCKV